MILFTGPPSSSTLDPSSCNILDFEPSFQDLLGLREGSKRDPVSQSHHAAWRLLPLRRQELHTGFTQVQPVHDDDSLLHRRPEFFTAADCSFHSIDSSSDENDVQALLTQFCEQSLAAHNSAMCSELDSFDSDGTTSFTTTSFTADIGLPPAAPLHLSDLEDIPSAAQISSLHPQTVTLNIIVGVLSVAQPRIVTTRWGNSLSLVEVLVGDETATGFAVTFWLPTGKSAESQIMQLRRQDVVLMENVGLNAFRGKVYGQSLRKGLTRVHLLWRAEGGGHYSTRNLARPPTTAHPQLQKTKTVKGWVLHFVGRAAAMTNAGGASRNQWDRPPEDTQ